jgi:hypothetical protein
MSADVKHDLSGVKLGDERRERRLCRLATRMAQHPERSVKSACRGAAESTAAYRLLHRPEVTPEVILEGHQEAALSRAALSRAALVEGESLLLLQDTTELDFSTHKALKGSGPLGEKERRGFFAHNRLLVAEEEGVALGLCGSEIWARHDEDAGLSKDRKKRPIEEKESYRWVKAYKAARKIAHELENKTIIVVGDRESDIYELYEARANAKIKETGEHRAPEFVVRSGRNRALAGELSGSHLHEYVRQEAPLLGKYRLKIDTKVQMKKKSGGSRVKTRRQGRKLELEVRACHLTLRAPYRKGREKPQEVTLWALVATETNPPKGQDPIDWILLTSMPVEDWESARRVLRIYQQRWLIEEYHRVLKTGCRVEQIALREADALLPTLAVSMIVAWRILYLRDMSRHCGELPVTCCFEEIEWRAVWIVALGMRTDDTRAPPSLAQMLREVAILGGHQGRPSDRPPGAESIWRGMQDMRRYVEALEALEAVGGV